MYVTSKTCFLHTKKKIIPFSIETYQINKHKNITDVRKCKVMHGALMRYKDM